MKNQCFCSIVVILFLCNCNCPTDPEPSFTHQGPQDKFEQIKINLWNNSPNFGSPVIREAVIMELDEILMEESSRDSDEVFEFYASMMQKVSDEIDDKVVNGIRIWMMYNHGFIIKTPQSTFAFDLIEGYSGWKNERNYELPDRIVKNIDVLFISHEHTDHYDHMLVNKIRDKGGIVITPFEPEQRHINGLQINTHYGIHSAINRIFEVTTENGYKIVHTGDNETAEDLPVIDDVDILLLFARTKESGSNYSSVGMRNCVYKLEPALMIPGHIHEFSHEYVDPIRYKWSFFVDDLWIPSTVQVMAWGEYTDFVR
jgi:L-ascorbate metabolism protein UlaG (beta-lactamase superfamily)